MSFIDRNELTLDCSGFRGDWIKPRTVRMPANYFSNRNLFDFDPAMIVSMTEKAKNILVNGLNDVLTEVKHMSNKCTCECVKGAKVPPVDKSHYRYLPDWLNVDRVIFHNPATIIFWKNGDKTVVKCAENETYNEYAGFCAAVAKQVFRTNSAVSRIVRNAYREPEKPVSEQRKEKSDDINMLLEHMKARILELRDKGYSCEAIAGITDYPESTVRNVIKDAKKNKKERKHE